MLTVVQWTGEKLAVDADHRGHESSSSSSLLLTGCGAASLELPASQSREQREIEAEAEAEANEEVAISGTSRARASARWSVGPSDRPTDRLSVRLFGVQTSAGGLRFCRTRDINTDCACARS